MGWAAIISARAMFIPGKAGMWRMIGDKDHLLSRYWESS
jgi:hypothetical protein